MYDFAVNPVKLNLAIQRAHSEDPAKVLAAYIELGGKVADDYSSPKVKESKKHVPEPTNEPTTTTPQEEPPILK